MKQTSHERKLLNQIVEARKDLKGFRRRKISHLLHDIDAVEQRVKSVGAIGKNTKTAYQQYYSDLTTIRTKIMKLRARRGAWFFYTARAFALVMAILFLFLYIIAGFNSKSVPTNIRDAVVWGALGIAASALTYVIYMVNNKIYVTFAIMLPHKSSQEKPTLRERLSRLIFNDFLLYAYLNTYVLLFGFTQSWAYPYLRALINAILQGETLPLIYAFFTVVSTIIGLIGGMLSIADFFEKRRHKKQNIL